MRSPIPWVGSKRRLAAKILALMPEHRCYVEVFGGSGAVLFARPEPAPVEVLNDLDSELVNLFRVLKHHLAEFVLQFKYALVSRQIYEWAKVTPPETLTDIQRAARFYYLHRLSFGTKRQGISFGTSATRKPNLNLLRLEENLSDAHLRLAAVTVEHLGWEACVDKYDREPTLFFLDPPYFGLEGYATPPLTLEDYQRLRDRLGSLRGRAILTINRHPEMERIFGDLLVEIVEIDYTVGGGQSRAQELICCTWNEPSKGPAPRRRRVAA